MVLGPGELVLGLRGVVLGLGVTGFGFVSAGF